MNAIAPARRPTAPAPEHETWPTISEDASILRGPFHSSATEYLALAFSLQPRVKLRAARLVQGLPFIDNPVQQLLSCSMLCRWGILPERLRDGADAVRLSDAPGFDLMRVQLRMAGVDGMAATMLIRRTGPRHEWSRALADRHAPPRLVTFLLRCYYRALR